MVLRTRVFDLRGTIDECIIISFLSPSSSSSLGVRSD